MPSASWSLVGALHAYVFYAGVVMMLALVVVLVARDVLGVMLADASRPGLEDAHARLGRSIVPCAVGFAVTAVARVVTVLAAAF